MTVARLSFSKFWLRSSLSPSIIESICEDIISRATEVFNSVANLTSDECTFEKAILPIAYAEGWMTSEGVNCSFPAHVHPDKAVRDASVRAQQKLEEFQIETYMRKDLYDVVKSVKCTGIHGEDARLLDKLLLNFKRNGLALPTEAQRKQLETMKKEIAALCIQFQTNTNEDTTSVIFTKTELSGLPEDHYQCLTPVSEVDMKSMSLTEPAFHVTTKYPDYFAVMKNVKSEKTRRRMEATFNSRCRANVQLLRDIVQKRQQMAHLLGYKTHPAYVLEEKMALTEEAVLEFLQNLVKRVQPAGKQQYQELLDLKRGDTHLVGDEKSQLLGTWDTLYYHHRILESQYQVEDDVVKQYFPFDHVTEKTLDLYQELLGLRFVKDDQAPTWHNEVSLYAVNDAQSGELMGHFYLDLYPREGKYGHAACFTLQPGMQLPQGEGMQLPVAAMVANFSKPTATQPSLLKHDEVVTYFHEFGHVMHVICSQTKYSRFQGTNVEGDFVEAPSQMLENWCWEKDILERLSGHYKTGKPLPEDIIGKLVKAKNVHRALFDLRQLALATFDMKLHVTSGDLNTSALYHDVRETISLMTPNRDTCPEATFGHLTGGYDAGYYGYMWSEVFSADMYYSRFKKEGIMNAKTGRDYRLEILKPGYSRDGMDSLKAFLGRPPQPDAFLTSHGII